MRFIKRIASAELPNPPFDRITRITFDLDDAAVHDYIMHEAKDSSDQWPVVVVRELTDELLKWARREDFTARLMERNS